MENTLNTNSIARMFQDMGYDYHSMEIGIPVDVTNLNYEVLSLNDEWVKVKKIIRKPPAPSILVEEFDLRVSPDHLFYAKFKDSDPHWVEAIALVDEEVQLLNASNEWVSANLIEEESEIDILDIEVEGQKYATNGIISHNTLYGDPTVVPGGRSIPFHASVRIKLGAGQQILDKNKNVIGINVSAKTIKNKIAAPFRSCNFEIHFGRGIKEHEQVFDILRVHGPEMFGDKVVEVSGSGAWKSLTVRNLKNELLVDKKFYKAEFDQILADPELGAYCDDLLERAMVKILNSNESFDFDPDSYEEARSIVMDVEQEFVDPEA
jgi:hypothetical protein